MDEIYSARLVEVESQLFSVVFIVMVTNIDVKIVLRQFQPFELEALIRKISDKEAHNCCIRICSS